MGSPDTTKLQLVPVGGHTAAVHRFEASPSGPPILFLHGASFHGLVWRPVAARLTVGGPLLSLDLPGHGHSSHPGRDVRWAELADLLLATVEALGLDRPVVAAHSMGAAIALLAALAEPDAFSGMWVYEPVVPPVGLTDVDDATAGRRPRTIYPSRADAYERYAGRPPLDRWDPEVLQAYVEHAFVDRPDGTVELASAPDGHGAVTSDWCHHHAMQRLHALRVPVALNRGLGGSYQSGWVPLMAARIPGAAVEEHPGLSHLGPMEDPARIAASIERFVAALGAGALGGATVAAPAAG